MIDVIEHGDVTQLRFHTWKCRLAGYGVSAFVARETLVDAGFPDVATELGAWVGANPVRGAIITHAHEDHAGGVGELAARGVPIQCAPLTDAWMRRDETVGMYRRLTWGNRRRLTVPTVPFTHDALVLRPTPGHSADHHVVWDAERSTVFGGDLFIGVKVRIAHHDEDLRAQVRALREVASWKPERFFDAHRGLLPDATSQLHAKADWIEEMIGAIEDLARKGHSPTAIRTAVLGREDATGLWSLGHYSRLNFVRNVLREDSSRS